MFTNEFIEKVYYFAMTFLFFVIFCEGILVHIALNNALTLLWVVDAAVGVLYAARKFFLRCLED